ncbi:MAG: hypothetical protein ABIT76_10160 [Chthoniobacterales bacterium]
MNVFFEFSKILRQLKDAPFKYALVGGVAMAFHDFIRFTKDIDILITSESYAGIKEILNAAGYTDKSLPWNFSDSGIRLHRFTKFEGEEFMIVDVMIGDDERYRSILKNAVAAESADGVVSIASKKDLIWMKSFRNSALDQADIEHLKNDQN